MHEVHVSDVLSYKTCRRAWDLSSPLRQNMEPNRPYTPFFVGQGVHYALECLYRDGIPLEESAATFVRSKSKHMTAEGPVFSMEEDVIEDQAELIQGLLWHFNLWRRKYRGPFCESELEILPEYVEYGFKAPLINPNGKKSNKVMLSGRIDGVARHKPTGTYWILEWKTARALSERLRLLPFDEQASAYLSAAPHIFPFPIEGILYTILRKKVPSRPRVLKNGGLSNAKIDSTVEAFVAHCRDHYGDISTEELLQLHGDVIRGLSSQPNRYIWRVPLRRTHAELHQAQQHLWRVAMEMVKPEVDTYPHGGFHCNFCRFRRPCEQLNLGETHGFALTMQEDYRSRSGYYGPPIDFGFDEPIPNTEMSHS